MYTFFNRLRPVRSASALLLAAGLSASCLAPPQSRAETDYGQVSMYVAQMLQNNHYSRQDFDDATSKRLLENYLKFLDFSRLYFTQADIDGFVAKYETSLDDRVLLRDITPAFEIYEIYTTRVRDRFEKIKTVLADEEFTFDSDRSIERSRKESAWPADEADADRIWRDILEAGLLEEDLRATAIEEAAAEREAKKAAKDAEAAEPKPTEPKLTEPDSTEPEAAEAELTEPEAAEVELTEPEAVEVEVEATENSDTAETLPPVETEEIAEEEAPVSVEASAEVDSELEAEAEAEEDENPETPRERILKRYEQIVRDLGAPDEEIDKEEVTNYFLSALAAAYDPHSEYFSQSELENFEISMKNELVGIGALLSMEEGAAEIQGLVVGGPADKGGELKPNDRIVGVAQGVEGKMEDVMFMKLQKIVELIRGKKETVVRLKVIPADADDPSMTEEIAITRDTVKLKDKLANAELIEALDSEGAVKRIGWINLASFYADMEGGTTSTTTDVQRLLERLMAENISGLVLDLRGNGGGSLDEAIDLTGLFIPRGPVVQSKDWTHQTAHRSSPNRAPLYRGPMVVLTDKTSASASEILAAALQDYNRALIVGESSTFGKGTVQTIMPVARYMPFFSDKSRAGALKVTIQKFYRIAGGSTQLRGVVPELHFPSIREALEIGEEALDYPLEYDEIESKKFNLFSEVPLPAKVLQERHEERIATDPEFLYIAEETTRLEERIEENLIPLNKEQRLKEGEASKARAEKNKEARKKRVTNAESVETKPYKIFKLTLDNVDEENLVSLEEFTAEDGTGMRMADRKKEKDEDEDEETGNLYPFGIEPVKMETLWVVRDLIELTAPPQTADVSSTPKVVEELEVVGEGS